MDVIVCPSCSFHFNFTLALESVSEEQLQIGRRYWTLLFCLKLEETLVQFVVVLFSLFFAGPVVLRRRIYHINLLIIMWYMMTGFFVFNFCRLVLCVFQLLDEKLLLCPSMFVGLPGWLWLERARMFGGCFSTAAMLCTVVERFVATIRMYDYERRSDSHNVILLATVATLSVAALLSYLAFHSLQGLLIFFIMICTILVATTVLFLGTLHHNRAVLREYRRHRAAYRLSVTFQARENVRVLRTLGRAVLKAAVLVPSAVLLCLLLLAVVRGGPFAAYLLRECFMHLLAHCSAMVCFSAVLGPYEWRTEAARLLRLYLRVLRCRAPDVTPTPVTQCQLRNCDGKRLVFTLREERDIHMEQLRAAWDPARFRARPPP